MNRVEKTQNCWGDCWFELFLLINAQDNLPPFPEIFFVQILRIIVWSFRTAELDVSNTDRNTEFFFWANTNEVSRITTDSTPLKFLCTGWHSVGQSGMPFTASDFQGCLQVCRRFSALPSPLVPPPRPLPPHRFLFHPRFSFRAAESTNHQIKNTKTRPATQRLDRKGRKHASSFPLRVSGSRGLHLLCTAPGLYTG